MMGPAVEAMCRDLAAGSVISLADREARGLGAVPIEGILTALVRSYPVLLHGTGSLVPAGRALTLSPGRPRFNRPPREREGFATDSAGVALLKALFSNVGFNLGYPYVISPQSPLKLTVKGWKPKAERERGYVHLIGPVSHFDHETNPSGIPTWQWVTSRADALFAGAVEVQRSDFMYPVERA